MVIYLFFMKPRKEINSALFGDVYVRGRCSTYVSPIFVQTLLTIMINYDIFILSGQRWKQGQWSKDEVDILQNNINTYCKVQLHLPTSYYIFISADVSSFQRSIRLSSSRDYPCLSQKIGLSLPCPSKNIL